ncbi:MAG: hypothetical protein O7F12_04795 [Nitrospirae bacterium]|nr:hypothetical protein [Nitrospirota bacterium]
MPTNALRKKGAKMSLQEAQERVEKLKRLMTSSNQHEAALAASRLAAFDIHVARAPRADTLTEEEKLAMASLFKKQDIEVLDVYPTRPYKDLGEIEVSGPPEKTGVNWEELHFELIERVQKLEAHAIIHIQLKGTIKQKILTGTALKYLNMDDIYDLEQKHKLAKEEAEYYLAQKERRDENSAPGIG